MIAFCDFHHGGMYHAMDLLFARRLGYDLYRPIGYEWLEGFWRVSDLFPTQKAYLEPGGEHWLGIDGFWYWVDHGAELTHKCMTFQQFCDMDVDLIISTHPGHEICYRELHRKHKPKAKLIRVCGNTGETIQPGMGGNIMDSTGAFKGQAQNYVTFHQEFPLEPFKDILPPEEIVVSQYLNFFRNTTTFHVWQAYKPHLEDFGWRMYGHQGDDGFLWPFSKLAETMMASSFIWHVKIEGYGHCVHNAFAASRPVITRIKDYVGKPAGDILKDGETCIDIGEGNVPDNVAKIRHYAQRDELLRLCANVRERFSRVVDFDAEELEIRKFIDRLI